jgi:hypothetical protein
VFAGGRFAESLAGESTSEQKGFSVRLTPSQHRQAIGKALKGNEGPLDERPKRPPDAGDSNMRNDFTACHGPQLANAAPIGRGRSRRRRTVRGLLALPLALALIAPGATALAAEATTGYSQTTPAPTTPAPKTVTTPAPKQETAPTKTSSTASKETQPTKTSSEPAKTSSEPTATTAKSKTLPFTGLDLRWITLGGLLLVGMGMSIMVAQRRRHSTGR